MAEDEGSSHLTGVETRTSGKLVLKTSSSASSAKHAAKTSSSASVQNDSRGNGTTRGSSRWKFWKVSVWWLSQYTNFVLKKNTRLEILKSESMVTFTIQNKIHSWKFWKMSLRWLLQYKNTRKLTLEDFWKWKLWRIFSFFFFFTLWRLLEHWPWRIFESGKTPTSAELGGAGKVKGGGAGAMNSFQKKALFLR